MSVRHRTAFLNLGLPSFLFAFHLHFFFLLGLPVCGLCLNCRLVADLQGISWRSGGPLRDHQSWFYYFNPGTPPGAGAELITSMRPCCGADRLRFVDCLTKFGDNDKKKKKNFCEDKISLNGREEPGPPSQCPGSFLLHNTNPVNGLNSSITIFKFCILRLCETYLSEGMNSLAPLDKLSIHHPTPPTNPTFDGS